MELDPAQRPLLGLKVFGGRPLVTVYVTRALSGDIEGLIGAVRDACGA